MGLLAAQSPCLCLVIGVSFCGWLLLWAKKSRKMAYDEKAIALPQSASRQQMAGDLANTCALCGVPTCSLT